MILIASQVISVQHLMLIYPFPSLTWVTVTGRLPLNKVRIHYLLLLLLVLVVPCGLLKTALLFCDGLLG